MRDLLFAAGLGLAVSVSAGRPVGLGPLPAWDHLDTEVSTNAAFAVGGPGGRFMTFDLEFSATPSNNVQVAFGRDADRDGVLSVPETALVVGWDCGEWVVSGSRPQEILRSSALTTNATKCLRWSFDRRRESQRRFTAAENGMPVVFFDGDLPPDWFFDTAWDTVRLTVRGVDVSDERFRAQMTAPGTSITFR